MKKGCLTALLLLLLCSAMVAEVPAAMTFQSVVRTASGELATNKNITLQLTVLQGAADGTPVYKENFSGKTNANGLITLKFGAGTPVLGSLADINWQDGPFFLHVAVDVDGGMNFVTQSTTQLLSVPYAMHAQTAERLSGTVSYNDLTDVPENVGFSGNYSDLSGTPALADVATSGAYADLQGAPELAAVATSGSYGDLSGKPALATVATSGNYADLSGKPALATVATTGNYTDLSGKPVLSRVATTGSYNDLTDKPTSLGGVSSYTDLTNRPNIKDSVLTYSTTDYNALQNKPVLSTVAFTGSYNDLTDKPEVSGGVVADYNALYNRPNFKDSVERYSTGVADYTALLNKPNIKDTVLAYAPNDYTALLHKPNIADSIAKLGFSGEYYQLKHIPNIVDSISEYGFSGEWNELKNMPVGNSTGSLMYYSAATSSWKVLEAGNTGDVLVMGADGFPAWVSAAFLFKNMSMLTYTPIKFINYKTSHIKAVDTYGMLTPAGTMEAPVDYEVNFTITPEEGWGVQEILLNGVRVDSIYYTDKGLTYLEFVVGSDSIYEFEVRTATQNVTYITNKVYSDSALVYTPRFDSEHDTTYIDTTMSYFTDHRDTVVVPVGYGCDFVRNLTLNAGYGVSAVMVNGVDMTDSVLVLKQVIVPSVKADMTVEVVTQEALYSLGEYVKDASGNVQGIVYAVSNGGHNAKIVSPVQIAAPVRANWETARSLATELGSGWRLPSLAEAQELSKAVSVINGALSSMALGIKISIPAGLQIWTSRAENVDYATTYFLYEDYQSGLPKTEEYYVVSIKEINK